MNPTTDMTKLPAQPSIYPFPVENVCNINFPLINAHMTDYNNYSAQFAQKNPIPLGRQINTPLLLDNNFYKLTTQLIDDLTSITLDNLKCMGNNDKNNICKPYEMSMQSTAQLDDLLLILDKYTVPLQKLTKWLNNVSADYVKYCSGNTAQIDKLKKLINKLNVITNNVETCPTITPTSVGLFTTNSSSCISLCILLIAIIGIVIYKSKEN